ncbi:MAG: alpha-N-arabinofuranosidase [Lachnospiraceae bacterium]|nr:alpha-N-arabinofuranosidase [Lachnospiraceae bacterium]
MAKLFIDEKEKKGHISPEIYGLFSEHLGRCIYEGLYVGEDSDIPNVNGMRCDVVDALKEMKIPLLRWPGGCFADEYHWKDGIGPKETRKKMINTHWGGVVEDNSFGTHEFFELCEQLGCKTYVNGNVGSGTVQEMSEWVEYITFDGVSPMADLRKKNGHEKPWKIDYFGVGNENWGCGGNMTPEYYANLYRRYQTYIRHYDNSAPIQKICGGADTEDINWTRRVLDTCFASPHKSENHGYMDLLSLHYYTVPGPWEHKGSATDFTEEEWYLTLKKALRMDDLLNKHFAVMDQYDPEKKIGMSVDEWGCWFDVEPGTNPGFLYQQNTVRDALVACTTLNIFNKKCDRVRLACLAQAVNVLQSVILTEGEKMVKTPTYHVLHMYRHHQDADLVSSFIEGNKEVGSGESMVAMLSESASVSSDGFINVTIGNLSVSEDAPVEIVLSEKDIKEASASILTGNMNSHNTFDEPENVTEKEFTGMTYEGRALKFTLPKNSVMLIRIR